MATLTLIDLFPSFLTICLRIPLLSVPMVQPVLLVFKQFLFKRGQRIFHNSGCASMGFELPAAIGAHLATNQQIICLAGDGSIMMNLQELAIIGGKKYPVKIILLNNKGYHSIRQTQTNYFPNNLVGCGPDSGLLSPKF